MSKVIDVFQLFSTMSAQDRPLAANLVEHVIATIPSRTADPSAMFYTPRTTLAAVSQHLSGR